MDTGVSNDFIQLQVSREITALFKFNLELIEQLNLSPEKYDALRKQILNHGNDSIRSILQFLDLFDFSVNPEKVKAAMSQRVVYKKSIFSPPVIIQ